MIPQNDKSPEVIRVTYPELVWSRTQKSQTLAYTIRQEIIYSNGKERCNTSTFISMEI
jgi:hypothetical protein